MGSMERAEKEIATLLESAGLHLVKMRQDPAGH